MIKKVLYFLLLVFVGIQLIPTKLNRSEKKSPNDLVHVFKTPSNIENILNNSCYDCHSYNTNYPWYAKIQPVRLFIWEHIEEGKSDLNFSDFGEYSDRKKRNKIKAIISQIKKKKMPPNYYGIFHSVARMNKEETEILVTWLEKINIE